MAGKLSRGRRDRLTARGIAAVLALGLLMLTSGTVLAGPMSGVDVVVHVGETETVAPGDPPAACTFHLHFQSSSAKSGFYDIHAGSIDGDVVATGTFDTTSGDSRAPATGVFALDEGTYLVAWDDEMERDPSFDSTEVVVACEAESPTPSPTPTGSELPIESESPAPTGSELPIGGTPTGGVAGVVVTPPATDTGSASSPSAPNVFVALALMTGVGGLALMWSQRLRQAIAMRRIRRR